MDGITTSKLYNGSFTPYETITGMKPRCPIDAVLSSPSSLKRISTEEYVCKLVDYIKQVHQFVESQHERVREETQKAKLRELGSGESLNVGDFCYVRRPAEPSVSRRLQSKNFDSVFQVVEKHGEGPAAKAYTLSDLRGKRSNLGFSQPVASERLTPVELLPLLQPTEETRTRLTLASGSSFRDATIINQSLDGKVYVRYDDNGAEECLDLSRASYRWI